MKYFIITGTSRGIGEALAYRLLSPDHTLFCISRNGNSDLTEKALEESCALFYLKFDLAGTGNIQALMDDIFNHIFDPDGVYLINNAGVIKPVKPSGSADDGEIISNVAVNLVSPILLVNNFIRKTVRFQCVKRIINISSGAGKHPYFGLSAYCSSKAGLDMMTRNIALEQDHMDNPVQILSFSPGVVETSMQTDLRTADDGDFIDRKKFIDYQEQGNLLAPSVVAAALVRLLLGDDFNHGGILDIRDPR